MASAALEGHQEAEQRLRTALAAGALGEGAALAAIDEMAACARQLEADADRAAGLLEDNAREAQEDGRAERLRAMVEDLDCGCDLDASDTPRRCPRCAILAADGALA